MATTQDDGLLTRAVRVLETLAGSEQPTTLPRLATRVGVSTSQTYRALRALQREGFVDHVGRQGYRLGTRALGLGVLLEPRPEVRATTRPLLARLAVQLGLTARLHLRSGPDRILTFVALAPTEPDVPAQTVIGERARLTRGCSGRAILAHLDQAQVEEVLRHRPPDGDPRALRAELQHIRTDGHAISHAHNHARRRGISVPLRAPDHPEPLGALSLSAPEDRIDNVGLRALLGPLHATADELGRRLGTVLGPGATTHIGPLDLPTP
ncbi:IclR family transcriptional regulator [Actinomycetospora sp. CA-084318]|uniref:IclR family transcriptional regulator n=1 Tax=Actinomycetospora sp. CA-084318 TaxID=3239892 RepID=UPI003D96B6E0